MPSLETTYTVEVLDRPGLTLPESARCGLQQELRAVAATCLNPLPDYQCISSAPHALDDKLIAIARDRETKRMVAFASSILLRVLLHPGDAAESAVLHAGLVCVSPDARRQGLQPLLYHHLYAHLRARPEFAEGIWATSMTAALSSLGRMANLATEVYPSPGQAVPSETHLGIARAVDTRYRDDMQVPAEAQFDEETFVFRNVVSVFNKDAGSRYSHWDQKANEFYRGLIGEGQYNVVLQIGFLEWEKVRRAERERGIEVGFNPCLSDLS